MKIQLKILIFIFFMISSYSPVYAQLQEQELKSVLIERFSRFIKWEENISDSAFIIHVLGNQEMYETIKQTYKNREILGLPVAVRFVSTEKPFNNLKCHILYVGDCYKQSIIEYSLLCQSQGALVLGHERKCKNMGSCLFFVTANDKVQFSYNKEALKGNKLNISYKLLQLAAKVE